jgi:hypothetical protein
LVFLPLVREIAVFDRIVFATPLYWYAMSGVMKTFFDRFADLLLDPAKRPLRRALAGREVWALVVGTDAEPPTGLAEPFKFTVSYFDMTWRGLCYARSTAVAAYPMTNWPLSTIGCTDQRSGRADRLRALKHVPVRRKQPLTAGKNVRFPEGSRSPLLAQLSQIAQAAKRPLAAASPWVFLVRLVHESDALRKVIEAGESKGPTER